MGFYVRFGSSKPDGVNIGILHHSDQVMGKKIEQLCLSEGRGAEICQLVHELAHKGYKQMKEKKSV